MYGLFVYITSTIVNSSHCLFYVSHCCEQNVEFRQVSSDHQVSHSDDLGDSPTGVDNYYHASFMQPTSSSKRHTEIASPDAAIELRINQSKAFPLTYASFMQPTVSSKHHFEEETFFSSAHGLTSPTNRLQLSPDERREAQNRLMQTTISYELKKKVVDTPVVEDTSWYDVDQEEEGIFFDGDDSDGDEDEQSVRDSDANNVEISVEVSHEIPVSTAKVFTFDNFELDNHVAGGVEPVLNDVMGCGLSESLPSPSQSCNSVNLSSVVEQPVHSRDVQSTTGNLFFGGVDFEGQSQNVIEDSKLDEFNIPIISTTIEESSDFLSPSLLKTSSDVWREVPGVNSTDSVENSRGMDALSSKQNKRKTPRKSHRVSYEKRNYLSGQEEGDGSCAPSDVAVGSEQTEMGNSDKAILGAASQVTTDEVDPLEVESHHSNLLSMKDDGCAQMNTQSGYQDVEKLANAELEVPRDSDANANNVQVIISRDIFAMCVISTNV